MPIAALVGVAAVAIPMVVAVPVSVARVVLVSRREAVLAVVPPACQRGLAAPA